MVQLFTADKLPEVAHQLCTAAMATAMHNADASCSEAYNYFAAHAAATPTFTLGVDKTQGFVQKR